MTERATAGERLKRILYLLPLASREGGVPLTEAADRLGVDVATVQGDIEEVTARAFYHPAGGADEMQILLEPDLVKIYSFRKFDRPHRLSGREALALAVGLRAAAREVVDGPDDGDRRQEIRDLARTLETSLAIASQEEAAEEERFEIDYGDEDGASIRRLLKDAARERSRCRITYLKEGAPEPEARELDPYAVVYASGSWYVIGYCHLRRDVRAFRVDRVMEAEARSPGFEVPADFDPAEYVKGGRVFRADTESEDEAVVRYSERVAPWVREQGPVEEHEGGALWVRFPNADAGWVVRHVLGYGGEAELLSPPSARHLVTEAVEAVLATS
jgi:proteasome accessory factor C